jgi:hypothetical protein
MNKILLFSALLYVGNILYTQSNQQQKTDSVCKLLKTYFNEKQSSKIYTLTGEAFKHSLSADAFKNICDNNLFPLGEIKEIVFENHADGNCKYKAAFGSMNLTLLLSLDHNDKIETFQFKPYADENARKNYEVGSTNTLTTSLDREIDTVVQPYIRMQATAGLSSATSMNLL